MSTDAKLVCVIAAIRHGIQTNISPGLSVNTHPNPFFLHVIGELDLKHIAERIVANLAQFEASEKKRLEAAAATAADELDLKHIAERVVAKRLEADAATAASAVDGP